MRTLTLSAIAACLVALLVLAGCDSAASSANGTTSAPDATATTSIPAATATNTTAPVTGAATLTMGSFSFDAPTSLHIKAGQAVTFKDPDATGGVHDLVTGRQGAFTAKPGAPSEFSSPSGINFNPGTTMTITFPTAGTYSITCTIHPSMQATITVA